jgi:4-hydroxy-tetrahydrodipicolinate reductase
MYVGAESPRDHILIDGSPSIDMTVAGGIAGDIATAAITVNAIPKVMSGRPGVLTMRDIPLLHCFNRDEARNPPKKK